MPLNINYTNEASEKVKFVYLDNLLQEIFNFNPIQAAGGTQCAPYMFLSCCAKTVGSRLIKLSDFKYNYIGHVLKWFTVYQVVAMANQEWFTSEK